jgi:probable rRNA maturation factor
VIHIDVANDQSLLKLDEKRLRRAVEMIFEDAGIDSAAVSLAVVDDEAMTGLHRKYLGKNETTDVLSFPLKDGDGQVEGEVVVSAETAATVAGWYRWTPGDELLLYVIHGALHLVGYRDDTPGEIVTMRQQETYYLNRFGLDGHFDDPDDDPNP